MHRCNSCHTELFKLDNEAVKNDAPRTLYREIQRRVWRQIFFVMDDCVPPVLKPKASRFAAHNAVLQKLANGCRSREYVGFHLITHRLDLLLRQPYLTRQLCHARAITEGKRECFEPFADFAIFRFEFFHGERFILIAWYHA